MHICSIQKDYLIAEGTKSKWRIPRLMSHLSPSQKFTTTAALYTLPFHLDFIDWDLIAGMYLII